MESLAQILKLWDMFSTLRDRTRQPLSHRMDQLCSLLVAAAVCPSPDEVCPQCSCDVKTVFRRGRKTGERGERPPTKLMLLGFSLVAKLMLLGFSLLAKLKLLGFSFLAKLKLADVFLLAKLVQVGSTLLAKQLRRKRNCNWFHRSTPVGGTAERHSAALRTIQLYRSQVYHSALCIIVQFLLLRLMGRTVTAVLSSFIFQMAYLLTGYYYTATDEYDIKWTMPHCVLTLKLIGIVHIHTPQLYSQTQRLSLDYYDGGKEPSQLSAEQQQAALPSTPSLLEVCGFSYFYGGFLVGPQFTLRSYQKLVSREMTDCPGEVPNSVIPALKRFSLGVFFLLIFTICGPSYPDSYYLTDEFEEGVCILSGLAYNGRSELGEPQWDACANMRVWMFETTPLFTGTIGSFNINTNAWVARHIFKRLRFLGNKLVSQMATLFFLAVWHGLHSGYILCFSMEFLIVNVERQAQALVKDSPVLTAIANGPLYPLVYVVQQFIHWLFMGYPLVPFCLFTYDKWLKVYSSVYFCGHLFFFAAIPIMPYLRKVLVPRKAKSDKKEE
ncbi:hypothetical protein NFI96_010028 [Prochilodus magdalenae]|nr:hypothetical protein NFI96_010028 [Prochilodus magdalenae]